MRIAILGTRGIPARYGGFETFAEELATRLAARGHHVTVYCRSRHDAPAYRGVALRYLPAIRRKYLETVLHTLLATADAAFRRPDAALYCNAANALAAGLARLAGLRVALNVDGLERLRRKWNRLGRAWYALSERLATVFPHEVVSDARRIAAYYQQRYGVQTRFIPYGAATGRVAGRAALDRLGLEPRRYFLYVSRLEPENNALLVREAFERLETDYRLALIGDAPYAADYIRLVRATRDPRIVMPGAIYGEGYHELLSHCFAYVHATEVGGTHPALIEAMGRSALTLYLDTPENAEVAGGAAIAYAAGDLAEAMRRALSMSEDERARWRGLAEARVAERYSWDSVTDEYERLLAGMVKR
jgi:glycosyltransferase involved in cell wall biosynthesis